MCYSAVYPAGFLYVFAVLRYLTSSGTNILAAQIIFAGIYIINLVFVLLVYETEATTPLYAIASLIFSKRIHSIYMLRMFNDCIAVVLGYISLFCFMQISHRLCAPFNGYIHQDEHVFILAGHSASAAGILWSL